MSDSPYEPDSAIAAATIAAAPPEIAMAAPVARQQRISSVDVLRGVAVLGILLMNITGFGLPHWAYTDPSVAGGATGPNLIAWMITSLFFEGTFRGMFSLLFGAGVILLTGRLESRLARSGDVTVADIYYRRNIWLIIFGIVHAYLLLWPGDVLYVYGMVGLFLFVFRKMSPTGLIVMAVVTLSVAEARYLHERHEILCMSSAAADADVAQAAGDDLTKEQQAAIDAWNSKRKELKPDDAAIREEVDSMHRGYLSIMKTFAPINLWLQTKYLYKNSFWDAAGFMFLGMALMTLDVLSAARSSRTYWLMMVIGYAVGLAVNGYETWLIVHNDFSIESFARANLTYDLGRLAMVFGHIGLIVLIFKAGALRWLTTWLACVGRMALTNYLMASVVCGYIFNGYGLSRMGELQRWQLYVVVAGVWTLQIIVSPIWLSVFQFGPAEWLWRSLTYWRVQPLLRRREVAA